MEEVVAHVETNLEDWRAFQKAWCRSGSARVDLGPWLFVAKFALWIVMAAAFLALFRIGDWPTAGIVSIIFVATWFYLQIEARKIRKAAEPMPKGLFLGAHRYVFSPTEIHAFGRGYESKISWSAVRNIEETTDHIILYIDSAHGLLLPKRDLANPSDLLTLLRQRASSETHAA